MNLRRNIILLTPLFDLLSVVSKFQKRFSVVALGPSFHVGSLWAR